MKVVQIFNVNDICNLCREMNLFTQGTIEEYDNLYNWFNKPYTDEILFEIATYIKKYSDEIYSLEDIAGAILRGGVTRYID